MRNHQSTFPFVCAVIAAMLSAQLSSAQETTDSPATLQQIDSIVAVVEEDIILRSDLDRALGTIAKQIEASGQTAPSQSILERQVLERLAVDRLQLQRAAASGIRVSDQEIDRYIQRVAAESGITTQQMQQTIMADGITWIEFRTDVHDQLAVQRLRQRVAASRINVSETEVDIFLDGEDEKPGEYKLSHILVSLPEGATPDQIREARNKVGQVLQEISNGMDFATAAITYSDGQRALQGGELGWRPSEQLPPVFNEALGQLEAGQITEPLRSPSGFHILRVDDFREAAPRMVEEYSARHLMVSVSELLGPIEAEEKVRRLHREISAGADFAELAKEHSDDQTSANLGGDLGWFEPAAFGPGVAKVLIEMTEGQLSEPFQTQAGWHILKHQGSRTVDRTVEFERNRAREAIRARKMEEEVELWLRQLRDEAFIEYRLG